MHIYILSHDMPRAMRGKGKENDDIVSMYGEDIMKPTESC
jgi:hypothetical protein